MKELNKSQLGLGKVRNKINPTLEELTALELKYHNLLAEKVIQGPLSSLDINNPENVTLGDTSNELIINLNKVNSALIEVDIDQMKMLFHGGEQGKPVFLEFENNNSNGITFSNLRAENGSNPWFSIQKVTEYKPKTVLEIVRLGDFYYLIGIYRDPEVYTLEDLVNELNLTFDESLLRIRGVNGSINERPVVKNIDLPTLPLGTVTLKNQSDYAQSGYSFILFIPQDVYLKFYPKFILPIIEKLEKDTSKYLIEII